MGSTLSGSAKLIRRIEMALPQDIMIDRDDRRRVRVGGRS
jgi:hypothetical protein